VCGCTLNLALRGVHTHKKVHAVYTHIIMVCELCTVLAEHIGVWLVHAQCGYMLSRNGFFNGARKVLVCGGGVLKFGMV
jgi:hypothetical protein